MKNSTVTVPAGDQTIGGIARQINALHTLACLRAGEAVQHATDAGTLLLKVKAQMGHGRFIPWCQHMLTVTERQAQRYMAAAKGKPTPIRKLANTTSVSYLPKLLNPGRSYHFESFWGWDDQIWVAPAAIDGFWYLVHLTGAAGDGGHVTTLKKSISTKAAEIYIQGHLDPDRATTTTRPCAGAEENPFSFLFGSIGGEL